MIVALQQFLSFAHLIVDALLKINPGLLPWVYFLLNNAKGSPVSALTHANISKGVEVRFIAGNPLSGTQTTEQSWLNPTTSQLTVIEEGTNTHEMLGWIMPRLSKFSVSGSFLSGICSCIRNKMTFSFDTRVLGGERNMIMSGEYDKVFPMDIYPEFLIKAIIAGDIDKMEALGIYEVAPEDFATERFHHLLQLQPAPE